MPILQVSAEKQLANDYLHYAVSVVNRAIPNAIDGLLISHRRIINTMLAHNMTDWYKTASASGLVIAERHPHGSASSAIYGLASKASNMCPLLDGYGNIGGHIYDGKKAGQLLSNDGPAADRYTKTKLSEFALAIFDIEPQYLESKSSYTNKHTEILQYVPALPLALINAQQSVGVGYACNSASFNLHQIGKAIKALLTESEIKATKALGIPDFTTFGNIERNQGILDLHETGRGSLRLIGSYSIQDIKLNKRRNAWRKEVLITDLPTGSAERFLTKLKKYCDEYKITTIADANDLSDGQGIKIQLIGRHGASASDIEAELLRFTDLSTVFSANNTFVLQGLPKVMRPIEILVQWVKARKAILAKKFRSEIDCVQARMHILDGLISNMGLMQKIVQTIMLQDTEAQAQIMLETEYRLTNLQAKAILAINLKQLVRLNKDKLETEYSELKTKSAQLQKLIDDDDALNLYIIEQTSKLVNIFGQKRKTNVIQEKPVATTIVNNKPARTKRLEFIESASVGQVIAKSLWRYRNKLGQPINSISDTLSKELDNIYKDSKLSPKVIQQWAENSSVSLPITDSWANKMTKDRSLLERHICWSITKL